MRTKRTNSTISTEPLPGLVTTIRTILGARPLEVRNLDAEVATFAEPACPLHPKLTERLGEAGISRLYRHQATALDEYRKGKDVLVVTGTGSGKTLCYNLPVLESCLREPAARALYLFPTKALAQDQAGKLDRLLPEGILAGVYDGDTSVASRAAIRKNAHIVLTNPDMLHVGILPHQDNWHRFFRNLRTIVIDEAHTYRGVFGSHVAGVLRRLLRLCEWQNNRPQIIACSATIANPAEHFERLTGRVPLLVDDDAGPKSNRTVVLVAQPEGEAEASTNRDTADLLAEFAMNNVKTLAFCRSRGTTELVLRRARQVLAKAGGDPSWLDSYRGGYTPKERRAIEKELFKGRLRGLATTNAMELGVDVGGLDAVILNGYPGTVSSFWQQTGRAGRGGRNGLALMIAGTDPLEQYLVRTPALLLDKPVEGCTVNLNNPHIMEAQLRCAAFERPMDEGELEVFSPVFAKSVADQMVESGTAVWQAGRLFYPTYESPAAKVNIRGVGSNSVLLLESGTPIGEMEYWRALQEAHKGATYLHRGQAYIVEELDLDRNVATLVADEPAYFTAARVQTLVEKTVEMEAGEQFTLCGVRVTTSVTGYAKVGLDGKTVFAEEPLCLPAQRMDTVGVRLDLPTLTLEESLTVHALEHAFLVTAPLIAGCDRRDLWSCWYGMSPDTMAPALYIVDKSPGGIGLSERLFAERRAWTAQTSQLLESCPCEEGCPSCLWISDCRSSALDKQGALHWLSGVEFRP